MRLRISNAGYQASEASSAVFRFMDPVRVVVSHPFTGSANGWGAEQLLLISRS
jgi:hypothetical protein